MQNRFNVHLLLLTALTASAALGGAAERTFPFPMAGRGLWRIRESFRPAGEDGFLSAKGNDFVDGKGQVRRFMGVNLYGGAQMPSKQDAEMTAKTLAFWGFNAVRMMPQYTWQHRADRDYAKGPDPELLDRFDWFFAKLKERGIYSTLNLHSARTAGYRFADFKQTMKENKGIDNFDPTFIVHQKEWAKFIFDHVNPYTGLAYRDDPAVLSWEINNECSLAVAWFRWDLWGKMTPPFKAEFTRQFNAWLKERYGDTERLRAAWQASSPMKPDVIPAAAWTDAEAFAGVKWYTEGWGRGGQGPCAYRLDPERGAVTVDAQQVRKFAVVGVSLDEGEVYTVSFRIRSAKKGMALLKVGQHGRPYGSQGVVREFETDGDWQEIRVKSAALVTEKNNRVQIEFKRQGDYEIAGLSFVRGGLSGLDADESIERGNVLPVGVGSAVRAHDVSAFVLDVEDRYWKEMAGYVKGELKARQPVNGGTLDYGAGYPQTYADFLDIHFYFGGLAAFPGKGWDPRNWHTKNELLVKSLDDGSTQNHFGARVFGFPYTISEANQMHQAATAGDFFPILFSLAAFQNVSAIHAYTWTHAPDHSYQSRKWLDMHGNAKYLAHLPAAHNMFVRGDVKSGLDESAKIVYEVGRADERAEIHRTGYAQLSHSRATDPLACVKAVTGRRYVDLSVRDPATADAAATPYGSPAGAARRAVSSTGEIVWDATGAGREFFAVDTPRTKFLSQFGPAGTMRPFADGTSFTLGETLMDWAAISLTETASNQWLLAATGWQQPTGAVVQVYGEKAPLAPTDEVKAEGRRVTTMKAMGDVPFVCEGVRATIRLPVPKDHLVRVTPLNGDALPIGPVVEVLDENGFATFTIDESHRTVWYRIEFRAHDLPAFGDPIPGSGYDPAKPDCGMSAAKVFDAPPPGLKKIGQLRIPSAKEIPPESSASIGFEGLDRKLFEPRPEVYERLGACGVKHARVQTMWSRCETEKGKYDFSVLDGVVDGLLAQGVRPWFSVSFGNALYMKGCYTKAAVGYVPLYFGDECRQAWLAYVRRLARRYKGKVAEWEIWNECNIPQFWQPRTPNAADYIELVKITGGVIREEIPDAKIGGCTSSSGIRDWEKSFFELGGAKYIDFWCGHAYGQVPETYRGVQRVTTKGEEPDYVAELGWVRAFINEHGGRHVAVWQGESGFPSWFPANHWLFPRGVCREGWQSQANQAKWLLRRWLTDRRAGLVRSSFYQACDIIRHYSMSSSTQRHPAEHGILNGWTCEPKMSYFALGHYNALFATATSLPDVALSLTPGEDAGVKTRTAAFRTSGGAPVFVYYTPFNFAQAYAGKTYAPRTDARLGVPAELAPAQPMLVDLLRGGVYSISDILREGAHVVYVGLPLTDYPLAIADGQRLQSLLN